MSNVIPFPPPSDSAGTELAPFIGEWIGQPVSSVSRAARLHLGKEDAGRISGCGSIEELRQLLGEDAILAAKYQKYQAMCGERHLKVRAHELVIDQSGATILPDRAEIYPVAKITREGRKIIVHTILKSRPASFLAWHYVPTKAGC